MHESEKWKWSHSVVSDSYRPHELQPTRLLCPWVFQARVLEWGVIALKSLSFQNVVTDFWLRWVSSAVSGLLGLRQRLLRGWVRASHRSGSSCLRAAALGMRASAAVAQGPSSSLASGIFPDQGSNLCLPCAQAGSRPLDRQRSPIFFIIIIIWTITLAS